MTMKFMASVSVISLIALGAPAFAQDADAPDTSEATPENEARQERVLVTAPAARKACRMCRSP